MVNRLVAENAKLVAFLVGAVLIMTVSREALIMIYLGCGFVWFIVWLLAGDHATVDRENRHASKKSFDLGLLGGKYSQPD